MQAAKNKLLTLAARPWAAPVVLLLVTFLAYGLFFWRLGFYWDDQPISWIRYQAGTAATTKYFSDSRPVWAWLYQLTGFLLPQVPAVWQVFAMFWRWLGVSIFWLVLSELFPRRKDLPLLLALLVLLYPGFNQQWVSYVYAHFFIVLFFLLFSWYLMLKGRTWPALVFSVLNLVMFEYFLLLELARPFLILLSLRDEALTLRERLVKTFKAWFPYLGAIVFALVYRSLVYTHPGFGYSLTEEIARAPIATLTQLIGQVLAGLWAAAGGAWLQVLQFPTPAINGTRTTALYGMIVLLVAVLVLIFKRTTQPGADRRDTWWLLSLGAVMLLLGGVPYWLTNLPVSLGFPANRALLSFMFGACFLLVGLLGLLPVRARSGVAVLIIALAAGRQFLWSVDYVRDWQAQNSLFWQMTWRAPGIQPNTVVLMNEELLFNADNSLSAPLNWIYKSSPGADMDYFVFYPTNRLGKSLPALEPGLPINYDYLAGAFTGNTSDALAFYYAPPACLRLLDPDLDRNNRFIPTESLMREASALSNADRILREPSAVMPAIYGPEPAHGWCYHFEKAELARQFGDWETVVKLGDQAFELSDSPNNPIERFVFIEGYAHVGEWDRAIELSTVSYKVSKEFVGPVLCRLWARIEAETASGEERGAALSKVKSMFACNP
jgi:hypothetical protein